MNIRDSHQNSLDAMVSIWGSDCQLTGALSQYSEVLNSSLFDRLELPIDMGEYRVTRVLGRGGMGCVFEGEHRRMQRRVAIKVLIGGANESPAAQEQFLREVRAAARLLHPNIVTAFDAGQFDSIAYLVMEYIEGRSLSQTVVQAGPLSVADAVEYTKQVAIGLAHAHLNFVIHRDVKPGNIMLTSTQGIKILDLGLAAFSHEVASADGDAMRAVCGTPEFMAPEQFEHGTDVDARADVYGLGCTLYYLLTGFCPYIGSFTELMRLHALAPLPRLEYRRPDISSGVQNVLDLMLAKSAGDRLESMDEVIALLAELDVSSNQLVANPKTQYFATSLTPRHQKSSSTVGPTVRTVAVDFGQRFIAAATSTSDRDAQVQFLGESADQPLLRSALAFSNSQKNISFGSEAIRRCEAGRSAAYSDLFELVQKQKSVVFANAQVPSAFLIALLLAKIKREVALSSNDKWGLALTVPTSFGQLSRGAMRAAANMCEFENVRLIDRSAMAVFSELDRVRNEPQLRQRLKEHWVVINLSDLTMDVSVFVVSQQHIQMLSTAGDPRCNRVRWRTRLGRWILGRLANHSSGDGTSRDGELKSDFIMREAIEIALQRLANGAKGELSFLFEGKRVNAEVTESTVLRVCSDLIERLGVLIGTTLSDSGLDGEAVDRCLTVGTLTQLNSIRQMARNLGIGCAFTSVDQISIAHAAAKFEGLRSNFHHHLPVVSICNANELSLLHQESNGRELERRVLLPRLSALPADISQTFRLRAGPAGSTIRLTEATTIDGTEHLNLSELRMPKDGAVVPAGADVTLSTDSLMEATIRVGSTVSSCNGSMTEFPTSTKELFQRLCSAQKAD